MKFSTRSLVLGGIMAATYFVLSVAVAPLAYGPIQLRISSILFPLALFDPVVPIAFALGNFFTNLYSPFGPWDYLAMPLVTALAAVVCWKLRRLPWAGIVVQSLVIALGVAIFPLGMGGGIPFWPTVVFVFISTVVLVLLGYGVVWRKYGRMVFPGGL